MKPTLFGYGITTKAIANSFGGGCTFFDDNVKEPFIDTQGNQIFPSHLFDPDSSPLEVTTPSLKPNHPLILTAKNLHSEYDYILSNHSSQFTVWISGTNGKTTTTQMLTSLLEKRGAVSGGNIGTPLAALDFNAPIWVLETSSFTLYHTHSATPNVYLLLPITPDHLDWHGTFEQYVADKLSVLTRMREGELAVIPKGLEIPATDAFVVEYDSNLFLANYFGIDTQKIRFKGAFLQDALLALAVTKTLFDEVDYQHINDFVLDAHRQEEIIDSMGRLWINDSKATNLDATIQAIEVFDDHLIHLILGGDDKGVDLSLLFEAMVSKPIVIYTIGSNSTKLILLAKKFGIQAHEANTLEKAVEAIKQLHTKESIAMLSPAAASLDQFTSYKHRGERFRTLIAEEYCI